MLEKAILYATYVLIWENRSSNFSPSISKFQRFGSVQKRRYVLDKNVNFFLPEPNDFYSEIFFQKHRVLMNDGWSWPAL